MFKPLRNFIVKTRKEIPFIIFLSFLISFLSSRLTVLAIDNEIIPLVRHIYIRDIHIHHFAFGIFFLALAGLIALIYSGTEYLYKTSILYGIGLGLTFDEFGMWLHLNDDYWLRTSYDAIIIISLVFMNVIFFSNFWKKIGKKLVNKYINFLK